MEGIGRISGPTKTTILQSMFDDNVCETNHYSLLDILVCKRYLIKRVVEEINNLLETYNIDLEKEIDGMVFFDDLEPKFYEGKYDHITKTLYVKYLIKFRVFILMNPL